MLFNSVKYFRKLSLLRFNSASIINLGYKLKKGANILLKKKKVQCYC